MQAVGRYTTADNMRVGAACCEWAAAAIIALNAACHRFNSTADKARCPAAALSAFPGTPPPAARDATSGNLTDEYVDSDGVQTSQADGRVVMGPVWDAAKAMGLCCGFPVEGEYCYSWPTHC